MNSHPAVKGDTGYGREALKRAVQAAMASGQPLAPNPDHVRRDKWLNTGSASESVLVGEDVTLSDVRRWLREALKA